MDSQAGRIVVGYDTSAPSQAALDWAATEAERRKLPLTVVHVVDYLGMLPGAAGPSPLPQLAENVAIQVAAEGVHRARSRAANIDITAVTHSARVAYTLIESSRDAELLVLGTRGHGDFLGALLGSVAFAVTSHAQCPVVVVRGTRDLVPDVEHPVVVGVDGSTSCQAALRWAGESAAGTGASLRVVCAFRSAASAGWAGAVLQTLDAESFDVAARAEATQIVADTIGQIKQWQPDLQVHGQIVEGAAAPALIAAADGAGLLVVGSRGQGGFAGLMLGSVSHSVIHASPCPVAVVRAMPIHA